MSARQRTPRVTTLDCSDAIVSYAQEVVTAIRQGRIELTTWGQEEWRRGPDGIYRRQLIAKPFWGAGFHAHSTSSPRYQAAAEAVRHDPDFGPIVGGVVGTPSSRTRFDEATVINDALSAVITPTGVARMDAHRVLGKIERLRKYLKGGTASSTVVMPLPGLKCYRVPYKLDDNLEIDELTDAEVNACARTGVLQSMFPSVPMLAADDCIGVRITIPMPVVIVPPGKESQGITELDGLDGKSRRFGERSVLQFSALTEDVLFVLRLAGSEFIATHGVVHIHPAVLMGEAHSWSLRPTRPSFKTTYEIDRRRGVEIRRLWRQLSARRSKGRTLPAICVRRFNAAIDRVSLDDAIVDYLIAAEALFLKDAGSPEDRGELGFRLALRAAHFLEATGRDRRSTFKFVKRAYDLRSTVAHGGAPPDAISIAGRDKIPLHEFVDELGNLMRASLIRATDEYAAHTDFATGTYWDRMLLSSGTTRRPS